MNEQRLESALSAIRLSDIATPIVTDDVLASITQRKRRVPWVLLILGLPLALGLWLLLYRTHEQSRPLAITSNTNNKVSAANPPPATHLAEPQKHDVVSREISKPSNEDAMVHRVYPHIQFSKIALNEAGELAARVEIELTNDELLKLGIAVDSGAVYKVGGSTVVVDSARIRLKDVHVTQIHGTDKLWMLAPLRLLNQRYLRYQDDELIFDEPWSSYPDPVAECSEVQSTLAVANCTSVLSSIGFDDSKTSLGTVVEYPRTRGLAIQIGVALGMQATCVDSMLVFEFADQGIRLPVDRLFVPIKYNTPWIADPNAKGELRRIVGVSWYLPTREIFARLPERVRNFIQPEYEATLKFVEEQLTRDQLCALLNKPSAFGLCANENTQIAIECVAPIPARDAASITVRSKQPSIADVAVVNDLGHTLFVERGIALPSGVHQVVLQLSGRNLPAGTYNVVVSSPSGVARGRILVE